MKTIIDEIYSDEERRKKRHVLNTMAQLRNSLHQSGIHTSSYEFEIELENILFKFETGKRIQQASWKHFTIIANAMLDIFYEIFSSNKITNLPFISKK